MTMSDLEKMIKRIDKLESLTEEKTNEIKRLKRANNTLDREIDLHRNTIALLAETRHESQEIPKWIATKPSSKAHHATPVQMWSDFHFGEVQPSHEVGNYNAYDDRIAKMRFQSLTNGSIQILKEHTSGLVYDGIVIAGAGDYIGGAVLHHELEKTNSETVFETIVRWVPVMAAAVEEYADTFGKVFLPMVQGNHDRNTPKVEHKRGVQECLGWVLCHWLADRFRDDKRVTFYVAPSWDTKFKVYNTGFTLTHGYGTPAGGPAGAVASMVKERQKYEIRDSIASMASSWLLMGHLHQTIFAQGAIMSGCVKGIDSYAWQLKCKPESPSQALFLVTPERGVTMRTPVFCEAPGERKLWDKVQYHKEPKW